jgi:hypothetical protein
MANDAGPTNGKKCLDVSVQIIVTCRHEVESAADLLGGNNVCDDIRVVG